MNNKIQEEFLSKERVKQDKEYQKYCLEYSIRCNKTKIRIFIIKINSAEDQDTMKMKEIINTTQQCNEQEIKSFFVAEYTHARTLRLIEGESVSEREKERELALKDNYRKNFIQAERSKTKKIKEKYSMVKTKSKKQQNIKKYNVRQTIINLFRHYYSLLRYTERKM